MKYGLFNIFIKINKICWCIDSIGLDVPIAEFHKIKDVNLNQWIESESRTEL